MTSSVERRWIGCESSDRRDGPSTSPCSEAGAKKVKPSGKTAGVRVSRCPATGLPLRGEDRELDSSMVAGRFSSLPERRARLSNQPILHGFGQHRVERE